MRPIMLFVIPVIFLATLVGLGFFLYRATASHEANLTAVEN
jgi:hypothetical protein